VLYGMKIVVSEKKAPVAPEPFLHAFTVDIGFGTRHSEVKWLQDALKLFNCFPLNVLSTGYYGEITRQAVLNFQIKYVSLSWYERYVLKGVRVGTKTRTKLNELLGG